VARTHRRRPEATGSHRATSASIHARSVASAAKACCPVSTRARAKPRCRQGTAHHFWSRRRGSKTRPHPPHRILPAPGTARQKRYAPSWRDLGRRDERDHGSEFLDGRAALAGRPDVDQPPGGRGARPGPEGLAFLRPGRAARLHLDQQPVRRGVAARSQRPLLPAARITV
jgi:hypothetical protein